MSRQRRGECASCEERAQSASQAGLGHGQAPGS